MAETHTKGVQRHQSVTLEVTDGRKPVFYDPARGRQEPPAVTAARERHQANNARIAAARAELDAAKAGGGDG